MRAPGSCHVLLASRKWALWELLRAGRDLLCLLRAPRPREIDNLPKVAQLVWGAGLEKESSLQKSHSNTPSTLPQSSFFLNSSGDMQGNFFQGGEWRDGLVQAEMRSKISPHPHHIQDSTNRTRNPQESPQEGFPKVNVTIKCISKSF